MKREDNTELAALANVLDAFGAEPSRWPADAASRFRPLIERSAQARRLVAEAGALDAVLSVSSGRTWPASAALTNRIVSAAQRRPVPVSGTVISLEQRRPRRSTMDWRAAGLLAASLMCGLYIGQTADANLVSDIAGQVGLATLVEPVSLVLNDPAFAGAEEDAL